MGWVPLWQVQTSQAAKADVQTVSLTDFNLIAPVGWCGNLLSENSGLPQPFWFCLPFSLAFQLVLSAGRGLLILVTLRIPAGIRKDGLWPPCPCQRPPCWCSHLPAFAKRAVGHPASCLLYHPFWPQTPLSDNSVGNLGEGPAQALSAQRSHTAKSA